MRFVLLKLSIVYAEGSFNHVRCSGALVGARAKALAVTKLKETQAFGGEPPKLDTEAAEKKNFLAKVAEGLSITSDGALAYM